MVEYHDDDDPPRPIGDPGPERPYRFSGSELELKMGRGARRFDLVERECRFVWPKSDIVGERVGEALLYVSCRLPHA